MELEYVTQSEIIFILTKLCVESLDVFYNASFTK